MAIRGISANRLPSTINATTMAGALDLGSTGQLVFPATQNASAGANTLDDYEEGSWTPSWTASSNPSAGNATIACRYTKNGRGVSASFLYTMGSTTTYGSGFWSFSLPFTMVDSFSSTGSSLWGNDATGGYKVGINVPVSTTQTVFMDVTSIGSLWSATTPHTWAVSDQIAGTVFFVVP
jgi:hypothetical protein